MLNLQNTNWMRGSLILWQHWHRALIMRLLLLSNLSIQCMEIMKRRNHDVPCNWLIVFEKDLFLPVFFVYVFIVTPSTTFQRWLLMKLDFFSRNSPLLPSLSFLLSFLCLAFFFFLFVYFMILYDKTVQSQDFL